MPLYVHRTTFQVLPSTSTASLTEPEANYVKDPSPWPFTTEPARYWLLTSDVFSVVDQATKDAIDTALLVASRDELANDIDRAETYLRAFALVVLDEFNDHSLKINEILDAIDAGNNASQIKANIAAVTDQPQRTIAQLKTVVRNRLDT